MIELSKMSLVVPQFIKGAQSGSKDETNGHKYWNKDSKAMRISRKKPNNFTQKGARTDAEDMYSSCYCTSSDVWWEQTEGMSFQTDHPSLTKFLKSHSGPGQRNKSFIRCFTHCFHQESIYPQRPCIPPPWSEPWPLQAAVCGVEELLQQSSDERGHEQKKKE